MTRIRVETDGAIRRLVLARPAKKNALDRKMVDALESALNEAAVDDRVRVVAIAADGADFCAGADLHALAAMVGAPAETQLADAQALARVYLAIRDLRMPVVALVRGRAIGGGAGLATACDIVLAHEQARFGYPEVTVGFVPALVLTMLRRAVGEKVAADLVLTGRTVSAVEAHAIGLVSRVAGDADFDAAAVELLNTIAAHPPGAIAMTKRLLHDLDALSFSDGLALGAARNAAARATAEFRDAVTRFTTRPEGR
ncbi:MAG: enoyl-CoA hydratase-related protein [Gemmatimonadaceae bacterium]